MAKNRGILIVLMLLLLLSGAAQAVSADDITEELQVDGVADGHFNQDVIPLFTGGTALLNGQVFNSGTVIKLEGQYHLVVTGTNGSSTSFQFTIDKTKPDVPMIDKVTDQSTAITGQAERKAEVTVRINGTFIGTAISSDTGKYTVPVSKQKPGAQITVTAVDAAGNNSNAAETVVVDVTAPSMPTLNTVSDKTVVLTGKAEPNATVFAYAGNKKLGESKANKGEFSIPIVKQKAGTVISVHAVDNAGNKGKVRLVTVLDKTAPAVPTVNTVSDKDTVVSGKAESNAKVFAYMGTKKIGEATAKNGQYSIKITKQRAGTTIQVHAVDAAKNKSGNKSVKVVDKTPPAAPTVNAVSDQTVSLTGNAEPNATVFAYVGTKKIGEGTAKNGVFSIKITKQKGGTNISVYAVDAAKNKSANKNVKVSASVKYKTTAGLNLRATPNTNSKVIMLIPKGSVVDYLEKNGSWFKVNYRSQTGWVSSAYLQKLSANGQVVYPAPSTKTPGTYVNGILIVNKKYSLPSTYNPGINATAQKSVNAMLADAKAQGINITTISAYRSYEKQASLYNNYVKKYGKQEADRFSARPGHSEHQTGLAFDFGGTANQKHWLESTFGDTKEGKWLAANAHKYGFILRYPNGKESITGYMYEPWHFRYLGSEQAEKVKNSGKTLEEYLNVKGK